MIYNSYAVKSYTYEDYKKSSYSGSVSYSTASSGSSASLALKILAVIITVIVAVTAGLNCAPSAERINSCSSSACVNSVQTEQSNTTL